MPPRRNAFFATAGFLHVLLAVLPVAVLPVAGLMVGLLGVPSQPSATAGILRLATTTSTQNSGLLDELLPAFEKQSGIRVHVIAVGTGKALRMGASGDVDAVMVHAPEAELKYVRQGAYVMRRPLMYNFFVLLGPETDPAGAGGAGDVAEALRRVARAKAPFVSRGDGSGTHIKEQALWRSAGLSPEGGWYLEVGQGMGPTLMVANEKQAYTLSDEGTYHAFKSRLALAILSKKEPRLRNPYSVMAVNPVKFPHVRHGAVTRLIEWLTSPEGQGRIAGYERNGRRLFTPQTPPPR